MSQELIALSKQSQMIIGAGLVEKSENGSFYNTYFVALPNGETYKHRKLHAFVNGLISSGERYTVFDSPTGWRIGVLVCYDNNIVENGRVMGLLGVDILLAPHQTGGCALNDPNVMGMIDRSLWENRFGNPEKIEAELKGPKGRGWLMRWLPSRAHDQGLFLVFSNGVGIDDDEIRTGNAMILDPYGRIIVETWRAGDEMVIADLDASLLDNNTGRHWMRARRPGLYNLLSQSMGTEADTREVRFKE
jgi:predicted amidohydrolase